MDPQLRAQLEAEASRPGELLDEFPEHLAQAGRSPNPDAALCLQRLMSTISENHYCAGWLVRLEYTLWEMLEGGDRSFGFGPVAAASLLRLADLSEQAEGWWHWSEAVSDTVFVPLREWQALWSTWVAAGRPDRWQKAP